MSLDPDYFSVFSLVARSSRRRETPAPAGASLSAGAGRWLDPETAYERMRIARDGEDLHAVPDFERTAGARFGRFKWLYRV